MPGRKAKSRSCPLCSQPVKRSTSNSYYFKCKGCGAKLILRQGRLIETPERLPKLRPEPVEGAKVEKVERATTGRFLTADEYERMQEARPERG